MYKIVEIVQDIKSTFTVNAFYLIFIVNTGYIKLNR